MKNIKLTILSLTLLMIFGLNPVFAGKKDKKENDNFKFKIVKELDCRPVKNQSSSSTCWCFSATSFLESELLRMGKEPVDLSTMYTVRNVYMDKAEAYVRWHGNLNFAGGGAFHDVIKSIEDNGLVPWDLFPLSKMGTSYVIHGELDNVLKGYVEAVVKNRNGKLSPAWTKGFDKLLNAYFGENPEKFEYQGKTFTPKSYAESLGLNLDDYIEVSSFMHHDYYTQYVFDVPDNWSRSSVYNVPLDEFMEIIESSIHSGYTVAWASDLNKGFNFAKGIAMVPPAKWDGKTFEPGMEPEVSPEMRQEAFDNYSTQDDHGMHFVGIAKDKKGTKYFIEKNSWGEANKMKGYSYVSENYVKLNTTCIMVNKHAIPKEIAKKMGL